MRLYLATSALADGLTSLQTSPAPAFFPTFFIFCLCYFSVTNELCTLPSFSSFSSASLSPFLSLSLSSIKKSNLRSLQAEGDAILGSPLHGASYISTNKK